MHDKNLSRVSHKGGRKKSWNKGLDKTDSRISSMAEKTSATMTGKIGHKHTVDSKRKLREHALKNKLGGHTSKKRICYEQKIK